MTASHFGGQEMGHISNNGSYNRLSSDAAIAQRRLTPDPTEAFRFGAARDHADFMQGLSVFNSYTAGGSASSYTVQAGDNLRTVAAGCGAMRACGSSWPRPMACPAIHR